MTRPDDSTGSAAIPRPAFAGAMALIVMFAALARGGHDLWSATLVHIAMLGWAAAFVARSRVRGGIRLPVAWPSAAFLGVVVLGSALAANRFDAIFAAKDAAAAFVAFLAGANAFGHDDDADLLLLLITPVLWVQATLMIPQAFFAPGAGRVLEAAGTLVNPNIQAAFALFWIPPLGFRALRARREGRPALYLASGLAAAVAIVALAGSFWALICLAVATAAALAARSDRPRLARGILLGGVALVILILAYKLLRAPSWNVVGVPAPSGSDRLRWWSSAVRMFLDHPWFGIGPGGFPSAYPAYRVGTGQSTLFAHSLPFQILAELGAAGAAAALVFMVVWKRRAAPAFGARGAWAAGAILFLLSSVVNIGAEYLVNQITLGLFLGVAVSTVPAPVWRPRLSVAILAVGLAVLALPLLVSPFLAGRFIADGRDRLASRDFTAAAERFSAAAELDGTNWEAFEGRALAISSDPAAAPERKREALELMDRAIGLNRLSRRLREERQALAGAPSN